VRERRQNHQDKGRRYASEGRLLVELVNPEQIKATCRGDGQLYQLGWDRRGGWWCSCPAFTRCAHLAALGLVVAP